MEHSGPDGVPENQHKCEQVEKTQMQRTKLRKICVSTCGAIFVKNRRDQRRYVYCGIMKHGDMLGKK